MPAALSMARTLGGGFNPVVALPNIVWLIHPDDATLVSGEVDSIVCRKSGVTFQAPAAVNRMPANTTERPGHRVAQVVSLNADYLLASNAGIANAFGTGAFAIFSLSREASATNNFKVQHSVNTTWGGSGHRIEMGSTATQRRMFLQSTATTNHLVTYSPTLGWEFNYYEHNGSGTVECYVNNVSVGTSALADRDPAGLLNVLYGGGVGYHSVAGALTGTLSSTDRTNLYNWVMANA